MAVTTWLVPLLLIDHSLQQGTRLLLPQNVTLTSENFYTFLTWNPAPDATNNTQYEVERSNGNRSFLEWIKEASCGENNPKQVQRCQLHLSKLSNSLFNVYQARVRAKDGSRLSEWATSKELQLYKDSVVGPLNLFLVVTDQDLTVSASLPQTPLKDGDREVIMSVLKVLIILSEESDDNTKKVSDTLHKMNHTFENMKPNANYCIKATLISQPAKEAVKCIKMPRRSADDHFTPFVIALIFLFGFILSCVVGGTFLKHYLYPRYSGMDFPKSLTILKVNASALRAGLHLDNCSAPSLSLLVVLPSDNHVLTERERSPVQTDAGRCSSWVYCGNGLHPGPMGNEGCSLLSVAIADSSCSGELPRDDYPTRWNYRTAQELLESSEPPPPVRAGLPFYGLETVSWELSSKISNENRRMRWPSLCRTDIPLDSVKLNSDLDIQSLTYIPGTYAVVKDSGAYPEAPIQQAMESQAYREWSDLSKGRKLPDSSTLEARDRKAVNFSGYEFRQPILPCEL